MNEFKQNIISRYSTNLWTNLFTRIRFWTGSFEEVERLVPKKGTILDLGCGYGIFANYLAASQPKRFILGVDLDRKKLMFADKGMQNAAFRYGDATRQRLQKLDAIVLLDVLHHLSSYKAQDDLVKASASMLSRTGRLIIVEVDDRPLWKLPLARLADFVLYSGQPVFYRYRKSLLVLLRKYFGEANVTSHRLGSNPFPHNLYVCRKR